MTFVWLRTTCCRGAQTANYSARSKMVKDIKEHLKQLKRTKLMQLKRNWPLETVNVGHL